MSSHDKYAALLDAFIDGELSAQEAGEVREHLTLCADCQAYVSDALAVRDAFPDIEETVVPDGFAESVLSALPPRPIPWKKFVLPLAACLTLFLLVRGLPETVHKAGGTVSEVTSDMDAGGETPMMSVAYNPDNADTVDYSYDDADTMPPQAAASQKSAKVTEASEQEEALDGVLLAAGDTNNAMESAFDEDTAPLPASGSAAAAPVPEPESRAIEEPEAELFSTPVSVWTVPAEAAPLLKSYDRAGETKSGVWYALTPEEFDGFISKLTDKNMEAVPGNDTPPMMFPGAEYYIFVPL